MFKNYLRVAFRSLQRNRFYAAINIGGLAVGMAVALLIGLWIQDELSYDKYHTHYDRIVQVLQKEKFLGKTKMWGHQPFLLLDALRKSYGDRFEHIVASIPARGLALQQGEKKMPGQGLFMDADGPDMLTLKMVKGDRRGL